MEFYDVIIIGAGPAGLNCAQSIVFFVKSGWFRHIEFELIVMLVKGYWFFRKLFF